MLKQLLGVLVLLVMTIFSDSVHSAFAEKHVVINHGSFRGPRKHLVNPTSDHQFSNQLAKLPA